MKLFFSGILIGVGKILPGISGSVLAIRLGIYEKVMKAILHFFKDVKENIIYLGILGSGFLFSTIIGSKLLLQLFLQYGLILKVIFIIFIITGIPNLLKKGNSVLCILLSFLFTSSIFLLPHKNFPVSYFFMGIIESFSTIIPGVSGTSLFLSLGWYEEILSLFGNLYLFPIKKILPFILGIGIGGFIFLKVMNFFFQKYPRYTYSSIVGFLLSSLIFAF